ncbi:amino acid ABC transporter permease [Actinacidiphila bryophytorum]|uniref:amino acid ABC transporter permease n=1 Tax=Actinacidiphila bryophytorum TaxID=1436133 RepID=UPI002176ECAA|nr:amino acid ABC transporter permease [Actinacidiphila bryophytorum]UWE11030.1 amino acid ABC transporter permease [Actinacidiphila bryophytorum]
MTQHDTSGPATAAPGHPPPDVTDPPPDLAKAPPGHAGPAAGGPPLRPLDSRPGDGELLAARLVPLRRPGQWVSAAALLVLLAMLVHTLVANDRFQWDVVGHYFLRGSIMHGLLLTLWLTAAVMSSGYLLGIGIAAMRLSGNPVLRGLSFGYVWLIRSVPPLVQLLFWYELASLYPRLSVGVPFGPEFASMGTAHLFSGILAAYVGLTLDVAAFSGEIVRGGILSVDPGQREAARALGLRDGRIFRRIVLPQAMPAIVPASGNLLIGMLKATSIVSVIAVQDLLYSTQLIYNQNFLIMPLLLVATIWYVILTTLLSVGQFYVERHYARGTGRAGRQPSRGLWQVARANLPLFGRTRTDLAGLS